MTAPRVSARRRPLLLVVDDVEWSARSLESALIPQGFSVLRASTGASALDRVAAHSPDLVIVARTLPDIDGFALCRVMRDRLVLGNRVPLLATLPDRPGRAERLAALRAGAWDVLVPPFDAEELTLRLETYARAKLDADRQRETGLLDGRTGLYNLSGLERRATELGAWAQRQGASVSCVVLGFLRGGIGDDSVTRAVDAMAGVLRQTGRTSDVIGRSGQTDFVVLAPGADAASATRLADRLAEALRSTGVIPTPRDQEGTVRLRCGYDSVSDARATPFKGPDLIKRAMLALARAKAERGGAWLRPFAPLGPASGNEAPQ